MASTHSSSQRCDKDKQSLAIRARILFLITFLILPFFSVCEKECFTTININDSACVITDTKQIKCWGKNNDGVLGYGDVNDRGNEPNEMGDNLPFVDVGSIDP